MTPALRGLFLASLSVTVLALGACASTDNANMSNSADASRLDSILERAARDAKASGNTAETIVLLEQLHARNPDDAAIATGFGQALREDEQLNRARQVLTPFTEGKKPYPDAVTELSMVQLALGQYKEAELTARKSVELDPAQGRPYLALGTALDAQNYHEQAEVAFRKGIEKWKGDPAPIMNNLALNLASQNKLDQAIDMLKKAKEISPGRIELERNLRIITTLKEGANDFIIKQQNEKNAPAAPVAKKAEAPKKGEPATAKKTDDKKETPKAAPVKKEAKKEKPKAKEESASADKPTNARGSTQNFNTN